MSDTKSTEIGLKKIREPFKPNQIGKLPKPSRQQTDEVKKNFKAGIRCTICGGWHHPKVVHLDYVGHAALTDRLLDCDPEWNWEPVSVDPVGLPLFDNIGGLWIKLTVCGVTRLGYGNPDGKNGGNAIKEAIGDALRNSAIRFGAALDLWHKGELHIDDDVNAAPHSKPAPKQYNSGDIIQMLDAASDSAGLTKIYQANSVIIATMTEQEKNKVIGYCREMKAVYEEQAKSSKFSSEV